MVDKRFEIMAYNIMNRANETKKGRKLSHKAEKWNILAGIVFLAWVLIDLIK